MSASGLIIRTFLAQPFLLPNTYTGTVIDDDSPGGRSFAIAGASKYHRVKLAPTSADGSEDAPFELLAKYQAALRNGGTKWTVTLTTEGLVRTTYSGTTTNGQVQWGTGATTGQPIKNVLGYTANLGPLTPGASATASYQPLFCLFNCARPRDTEWDPMPAGVAASKTGLGRVVAFDSGVECYSRAMDFAWHPATDAFRIAQGALGTIIRQPFTSTRRRQPSSVVGTTLTPPWTVHEFLALARGRRLAAVINQFQEYVAGSVSSWNAVYLDPETWTAKNTTTPSIPGVDQFYDRRGVVLSDYGAES
jgi:hypothetical protein